MCDDYPNLKSMTKMNITRIDYTHVIIRFSVILHTFLNSRLILNTKLKLMQLVTVFATPHTYGGNVINKIYTQWKISNTQTVLEAIFSISHSYNGFPIKRFIRRNDGSEET